MSIFFSQEGTTNTPDFVEIDLEFITVKNLKELISRKVGAKEEDIKVSNALTIVQYAPSQYIKRGSSVSIKVTARNLAEEPLKFNEIISSEHLEALMTDCRFYMIKSSNEDNIQKARECSVWATTFLNQDKFKNAFQCYKHVFFMFGTNRSFELKGLARMDSQPDKIPDKSIWNGVSNIRLGGNFKIRWIRKKPLSLATIQKKLGSEFRDEIARATDGYEPEKQVAKKVALLFELPSEPYYKPQDLIKVKKEMKPDPHMLALFNRPNIFASQLASSMPNNVNQSQRTNKLGIYDDLHQAAVLRLPPPEKERKSEQRDSSPSPFPKKKKSKKDKKVKKDKKEKKEKKREKKDSKRDKRDKKAKKKKHKSSSKRRRHSSSSSSISSRSRSSSSSSSSYSHRRHKQKSQRTQKRTH